ncbi:hypothetical protein K435DRAFT_867812 [Dendrothele bispora CBS 962.96]|uniref:Uncharacterized protein n=1 Tax=Dendrothele bispora (strain CBS 962.96) TaxID=1314807 RepID=A0A4S8LEM6_DENBC|nr:hypothetical protein K435DRAFT_867812 [Dendrothele bispora CBS 962.96]
MAPAQFDPKAMVDFDSLWPRGLFPDAQHARLFATRPRRQASSVQKDYPDVFIASHRLGAGYSLIIVDEHKYANNFADARFLTYFANDNNDLVKTTRNIGAVRQVVADHKLVICAACAAGTHTKTCVPMGVGLPCVACRGSRIPCSLNSELDRLEVSSRTGYEIFAQCSPAIANQLRRVNASACTFITTSGLLDTQKFNLGSEIAILRQQLANLARVFHQLKASDPNFKVTPQLVADVSQLAGWTSSYSIEAVETFLSQPAPLEDAYYHPAFTSPSEIAPVPSYGLGDLFFPVGNKPSRIDVSPWGPFVDARNTMREEFTADQANGRAPSVITIPESSLVVNDAPYPTPVHPASTRDSPVRNAVTASIPDTVATSSTVVSFPMTEEHQSRDESFDEASSRDEDATKAFDQSMMWETPEVLLQPPVPRSSPPIAILPEEKDKDDNGQGNDDEDGPEEKDVKEDLMESDGSNRLFAYPTFDDSLIWSSWEYLGNPAIFWTLCTAYGHIFLLYHLPPHSRELYVSLHMSSTEITSQTAF